MVEIINDIKARGSDAIIDYSFKLDGIGPEQIRITDELIDSAYNTIDSNLIKFMKQFIKNVTDFSQAQLAGLSAVELQMDGYTIGHKITPISRVGCYVPGGKFPLTSSAIMAVVPAKVAGCKEIIACSPNITDATIVASHLAGATEIYNIGGVQAIAAMAFGSKFFPCVDKIVGPGNPYVTYAKKIVNGRVGIDFIAGPSDILIIADESSDTQFIVHDMLAQLEHGSDSLATLITTSERIAEDVKKELEKYMAQQHDENHIMHSQDNIRIVIALSLEEACTISNKLAPEHLELHISNSDQVLPLLESYGSLFIGKYSAEVFADFGSGINHILPTSGASRYTGGLSVKDFLRFQTYQKVSQEGLRSLIPLAAKFGDLEGLICHKNAALIRNNK